MPDTTRKATRQIVGISMAPALAVEIKQEAAKRDITLRKLFEEMWQIYKKSQNS